MICHVAEWSVLNMIALPGLILGSATNHLCEFRWAPGTAQSLSFLICNPGILTLGLLHRAVLRIKQDNQIVINTLLIISWNISSSTKRKRRFLERPGKEVTLHLGLRGGLIGAMI